MRLIRNPRDRELIRVVEESRFIASSDLALISGRSRQVLSAITQLRRSGHLPVVGSVGRITVASKTFYPSKTYVYGSGKRGHLVHWLHVAHIRALFTDAARRMGVVLAWRQHQKHYQNVPDALIEVPGGSWTLEVDNSTEGAREGGIMGKALGDRTLIVAFKSEERFRNLCRLPGLATWHGLFHHLESDGFNILTDKAWWNGTELVSLL